MTDYTKSSKPYEPPVLKHVGSVHELTQRLKSINPPSDGDFLTNGQALRTSG